MWQTVSCKTQIALQGRTCWPAVRTVGSSCHLLQGLPQLQPPGPRSSLSWSSLHLATVQGWGIKAPHFSLMGDSSDKQCSPQSSLPGWLRYYWSASEFNSFTLSRPVLSSCLLQRLISNKHLTPQALCFRRIWSTTR